MVLDCKKAGNHCCILLVYNVFIFVFLSFGETCKLCINCWTLIFNKKFPALCLASDVLRYWEELANSVEVFAGRRCGRLCSVTMIWKTSVDAACNSIMSVIVILSFDMGQLFYLRNKSASPPPPRKKKPRQTVADIKNSHSTCNLCWTANIVQLTNLCCSCQRIIETRIPYLMLLFRSLPSSKIWRLTLYYSFCLKQTCLNI